MSKILDWIKTHIWQTILIIFGAFFLPLIFVHIAYRVSAISPWFISTWSSGELITYIAGFEAFLGTLVLGIVALFQNDKLIEQNTRVIAIEDANSRFERHPSLSISVQRADFLRVSGLLASQVILYSSASVENQDLFRSESKDEDKFLFSFIIKSCSTFPLIIELMDTYFKPKDGDVLLSINPNPVSYHSVIKHLMPDTSFEVGIVLDKNELKKVFNKTGHLVLAVKNTVGDKYTYSQRFAIALTTYNSYFILLGTLEISENKKPS